MDITSTVMCCRSTKTGLTKTNESGRASRSGVIFCEAMLHVLSVQAVIGSRTTWETLQHLTTGSHGPRTGIPRGCVALLGLLKTKSRVRVTSSCFDSAGQEWTEQQTMKEPTSEVSLWIALHSLTCTTRLGSLLLHGTPVFGFRSESSTN